MGPLGLRAKSGQRQIITGPPAERSLQGRAVRHNRNRYSRNNKRTRLAARHQGKMVDEPPVECFHTGRPARQNGNKGQITIPILGQGSRRQTPSRKKKRKRRVTVKTTGKPDGNKNIDYVRGEGGYGLASRDAQAKLVAEAELSAKTCASSANCGLSSLALESRPLIFGSACTRRGRGGAWRDAKCCGGGDNLAA